MPPPNPVGRRICLCALPAGPADQGVAADGQRIGALAEDDGEPVLAIGLPHPVAADLGDVLEAALAQLAVLLGRLQRLGNQVGQMI